jgi:hypothetical protein
MSRAQPLTPGPSAARGEGRSEVPFGVTERHNI